jgi:hypothetical protein
MKERVLFIRNTTIWNTIGIAWNYERKEAFGVAIAGLWRCGTGFLSVFAADSEKGLTSRISVRNTDIVE